MNIEELRDYCLSLKGAEECFPFDETTLVFKVMGKMFAYISLEPSDRGFFITMKCDPEEAIVLRGRYNCVFPGYHSNKRYWNSIYLDGDMPDNELKEWISHSVDEVVKKLPKKYQEIYHQIKNED